MTRRYTRLGKPLVPTEHEELVESYNDFFERRGDTRFGARLKTVKKDKWLAGYYVPKRSSTYAFSLITDFGIHYVCAVIITLENQIFFVCKSTLNSEFKKLYSADSVNRCIKNLKTKGSINR